MNLAEREVARIDWGAYEDSHGQAVSVGERLLRLLSARSDSEAADAYWGIENRVFAQSTLYSAAEPATCVILAALLDGYPPYVRLSLLEVLHWIVAAGHQGGPEPDEQLDLSDRCLQRVREGYWVLIRESVYGCREEALGILEQLGADRRVAAIREWSAVQRDLEGS